MDVLEWTFKRATEELVQRSLKAEDNIVALKEFAIFIRQNRTKLERLLYSRRWVEIENLLTEAAVAYLAEMARNKVPEISLSFDELEIMLKFYACGMVGVLMQYMVKPHLDEEKLVIQIEKIITGKMFPGKVS